MSPAAGAGNPVIFPAPEHDPDAARRVLEALDLDADEVTSANDNAGALPIYVQVYRVLEGGEQSFLARVDADEFANGGGVQLVQRRFGAGKYLIRVRRSDGTYIKNVTRRVEAAEGAAAGAAAAPALTDRLERLLEKLAERPAGGNADFFAAVAQVAKANTESTAALLVPLLTALTQQRGGAAASPDKLVDVLLQGIKLGKETAGDGGGFGATVRELLPGFLQSVQQLGGTAPPAPPMHALPPSHGAPDVQPQNGHQLDAPQPGEAPAWVVILAPYIPQLLQLASFHASPEHWAADVVDRADGERLTFIEDQLKRGPAFRQDFFRVFPATIDRRSWFEQFFDALTAELAEMRAEQDHDPGD